MTQFTFSLVFSRNRLTRPLTSSNVESPFDHVTRLRDVEAPSYLPDATALQTWNTAVKGLSLVRLQVAFMPVSVDSNSLFYSL